MASKKEALIEGIYTLVTKKTTVNELDPTYGLIYDAIGNMSEEHIGKFFKFYATDRKYFNKEGFSSIMLFQDALRDYKDNIADTLWRTEQLETKTDLLAQKVNGVFLSILKPLYAEEMRKKAASIRLDKLREGAGGALLLDAEEIELIEEWCGGLYPLCSALIEEGYLGMKDRIRVAYRSKITQAFLYKSTVVDRLTIGVSRQREELPKEVVVAEGTQSLISMLKKTSQF